MKKVAILNIYQGLEERGAEVLIDQVAKGLAKDFEITIFSARKTGGKPYKTVEIVGIKKISPDVSKSYLLRALHKFFLDPYSLQILWFTLLCLPKINSGKFDIVISINGFWQMISLKVAKIFTKFKLVSTGFAGVGKDSYWNVRLAPNVFIPMTEAAARWAKKINPKVKIIPIGGGVDLKRFTPEGDKVSLNIERPLILCVAALVSYKRVDLTIKAVAKMKKGSLVVIGDGPEKTNLQNLGNKLLGEQRFKILKIPYSEIEKYYRAADVFTLPSEGSEAFGIVYLEAMATEVPVVAPDDGVRREIVGNAGIFVDVENTDEYAGAIMKALEKNWEDVPRQQAAKFSWEKICAKYKKIFENI